MINVGDVFMSCSEGYYIYTTRYIHSRNSKGYLGHFFLVVNTGELIGVGDSIESVMISIKGFGLQFVGHKGCLRMSI